MSSNERMDKLFDAARLDGPNPESRIAMWAGIQTASLTAGATASTSALGAAKAAVLSSKLVLGLVLGASLTVGVASAFVVVTLTQPSSHASPQALAAPRTLEGYGGASRGADTDLAPNANAGNTNSGSVLITGHLVESDDGTQAAKAKEDAKNQSSVRAGNPASARASTGAVVLSEQDRLAGEARMVREARGALHRGDPDLALRIVRAARTQPGARMVPEELTVEAQVLRAMGDEAGAKQVDADLANRFPDHTLTH